MTRFQLKKRIISKFSYSFNSYPSVNTLLQGYKNQRVNFCVGKNIGLYFENLQDSETHSVGKM